MSFKRDLRKPITDCADLSSIILPRDNSVGRKDWVEGKERQKIAQFWEGNLRGSRTVLLLLLLLLLLLFAATAVVVDANDDDACLCLLGGG